MEVALPSRLAMILKSINGYIVTVRRRAQRHEGLRAMLLHLTQWQTPMADEKSKTLAAA
jgi:hypothetical protein